ncbi:tyrosine-type recombinase/integrase [Micromonospora sp. DT47]|uniref:tyrosine-type recombinase/integrase n=1 Tax=Micromonospora sp. DT47 TaxID=3393431 RepID=UPI003CED49CC
MEREAAGDRWHEHGLLFTTKIGTPIEPRNIHRHFDQLCERAGVRRIRVHDLRHSCATLLYDQGVPLERIQDVLGHSSPPSPSRSTWRRRAGCSRTRSTGSGSSSMRRRRGQPWGSERSKAGLP